MNFCFWIVLLIFNIAFFWSIIEIYLDKNSSTEEWKEINEPYSNIYNNSFQETTNFSDVENNLEHKTSAPITPLPNRKISGAITEIPYTEASVSVTQTPLSPFSPIHQNSSLDKVSLAIAPLSSQLPSTTAYTPRISQIKCNDYMSTTKCFKQWREGRWYRSIINAPIRGGVRVLADEFAHMVALGIRNSDGKFILICGGSLIAPSWVLTAAHCTYRPNANLTEVRMGTKNLSSNTSGITVAIKRIIRHSDYKPPALYADIALIQLTYAVIFTNAIRPACLYPNYNPRRRDFSRKMTITGWGSEEFEGESSEWLQKTEVDLIDDYWCSRQYGISKEIPYGISPDMMCAGDPRGNWTRDTCQGDSGGPLQLTNTIHRCSFEIVGVTSFGQGCGIHSKPGVYIRLSMYLPWIENIVWPT